ncbi:MAG: enolase C-terminal domain-like protein [Chloroflexota bacterium]|jgi:mannonate dehydratase
MSNVRIRDIKVILTEPEPGARFTVVKIDTTEPGLYGLGCASLRTRPKAVKAAIEEYLKPFLIGKDTKDIEDIWQSAHVSSYWRNGPILNNALSGIDEALWDIKGKIAGMPVYDLLGGQAREAAAVYAHASAASPEEVEDQAWKFLEEGYHHIRLQVATPGFATYGASGGEGRDRDPQDGPKWITKKTSTFDDRYGYAQNTGIFEPKPYMRSAIALLDRVRNSLGWKVELLHDVHERLPTILAVDFAKEVEQFKLFFLEDLLPPHETHWYERVREQCSTPLSIGEIFNNPLEVVPLIHGKLIDFIRTRLSPIGGITPARKYSAMAELMGIRTAFQGPGNVSPVGQAAHLNVDLSISNFGIQEEAIYSDRIKEIFPGSPEIRDGYMWSNGQPGLGIDINEELAAKYPHNEEGGGHFDNVRRADGTVVRP